MRLRRVDSTKPGISRQRRGRGWAYYGPDGARITDPEVLQRISGLVIPPAWTDVWICPVPNGHIQALGTDAAGRRQYRYHDRWRAQRNHEKHEKMLEFAAALPSARKQVSADLQQHHLTRSRVMAAAFRLLDLGFFRVGSEEYAETNGSFGLATMRREHASISRGVITFDYTGKSGKHRVQSVADDDVIKVVAALKRRRGGSRELLAFRASRGWVDVKSEDINDYVRDRTGGDYTAKDFRTWHATVLCAVGLGVSAEVPESETARRRAVTRAVKEVAHYLGNTPAVCRASYIDPRVIDLYHDGITVAEDLHNLGAGSQFGALSTQGGIEAAVLAMLRDPQSTRRRRAG